MVKGIDMFREAFKDFADNYVIIGGTACDIILEDSEEVEPRATDDIDMILVVEKVTPEFGRHFWQFIADGEYQNRQRKRGEGKEPVPELYRFIKPKSGYPVQIELLSVQPSVLGEPTGFHLTPIPLGEELSSLSAILIDSVCYDFTIRNSIIDNGLRVASPVALIALKSRAFLNLTKEKETNPNVRSRDIKKHRMDVFLLMSQIAQDERFELPESIRETLQEFAKAVEDSLPNQSLQNSLGVGEAIIRGYIETMRKVFGL
jgi:hypothetical protein